MAVWTQSSALEVQQQSKNLFWSFFLMRQAVDFLLWIMAGTVLM